MNAAFAIGRICDMESGRRQMLMLKKSDYMARNFLTLISINNFHPILIIFMQASLAVNYRDTLLCNKV